MCRLARHLWIYGVLLLFQLVSRALVLCGQIRLLLFLNLVLICHWFLLLFQIAPILLLLLRLGLDLGFVNRIKGSPGLSHSMQLRSMFRDLVRIKLIPGRCWIQFACSKGDLTMAGCCHEIKC
nr:hypothetical protein Iba_chr13aCG4610 [Ipomoea batatas]